MEVGDAVAGANAGAVGQHIAFAADNKLDAKQTLG